jgi:hypothetical protein
MKELFVVAGDPASEWLAKKQKAKSSCSFGGEAGKEVYVRPQKQHKYFFHIHFIFVDTNRYLTCQKKLQPYFSDHLFKVSEHPPDIVIISPEFAHHDRSFQRSYDDRGIEL